MDKAIVRTLGLWLSQAATRILPNTGWQWFRSGRRFTKVVSEPP